VAVGIERDRYRGVTEHLTDDVMGGPPPSPIPE
jgi:hypothetical protein